MRAALGLVAIGLLATACGDDGGGPRPDPTVTPTVAFELEAPLADATFWDLPWPSDLRLAAGNKPDLTGFPNPRHVKIVSDLAGLSGARVGFPLMPIAYFHFLDTTAESAPVHAVDALLPIDQALLVDIDASSPERGHTFPIVAQTLPVDGFAPDLTIAIAPRPGIVLRASTRYAFVMRRAFAPHVEPALTFAALAAGETPEGSRAAAAMDVYTPLWSALTDLNIPTTDLLSATVFTTGDEVSVLRARSESVRTKEDAVISDLHVDLPAPPSGGAAHRGTATARVPGTPETRDGFCALAGTVTFPQYQTGTPPFDNDGGVFVYGSDGMPMVQSHLAVPLRITLPLRTMPAAGFPLWQYFHGSGGASFDIVDEGPTPAVGEPETPGQGPGKVVAQYGIAAAATALPVNPERIPGAASTAYLQLTNLPAFPHTFQQGVFEQRLLLDALLQLQIDPAMVATGCPGVQLPAGATAYHFNPDNLTAGGHSMGGMYTNLIGAVEPRYGALTPFGAGGFWNLMILKTDIEPEATTILGGILNIDADALTFVHPVLGLLATGWEIAEPGAAMSRIERRPLAGLPARHVYEPIGLDDVFFPNPIFDAAALAYGNQQAGDEVWTGTQDALATDHLDGRLNYPVSANRPGGLTGVTVQFADDGIVDSHQIFRQLDSVKNQYGCFLATYIATGTPVVIDPNGTCPGQVTLR